MRSKHQILLMTVTWQLRSVVRFQVSVLTPCKPERRSGAVRGSPCEVDGGGVVSLAKFVCLFSWLYSVPVAKDMPGIKFRCCHIETEVEDQTGYLTQTWCINALPANPSTEANVLGTCHYSYYFECHFFFDHL